MSETPFTHVVCCNDSVEHVFVGDIEDAEKKCDELARENFERNKLHWETEFRAKGEDAYKAFRKRLYWHVHSVPMTVGPGLAITAEKEVT